MRKRLRIFKAKTNRLDVLIRANLYDIRTSAIGKVKQTRKGVKMGKHEFIGAFAAVMPRGNRGVFKREGKVALANTRSKIGTEIIGFKDNREHC